jgi:hypothetical protein
MKQSFMANYVIVTMATSAILTICSYMLLTWTNKIIPTELTALLGSFSGGSVMSNVFKATGLKQELRVKLSAVDYALMGLAIAMMASVVNYNLLIWAGREIPPQTIVAINTMVTIVVSGTTFRNSETVKNVPLAKTDEE